MNTVFILVMWDHDNNGHYMPGVRQFEDQHEAIEALKNAKPTFVAHLYQCNPDGVFIEIKGW